MNENASFFGNTLLEWHLTIDRELPWKADKDPYKIWLSEIIMQQTRVAQGTPYYLKFVEAFPTVIDLADAKEDFVLKLWQGLGYYSRARNLHHAAMTIRDDYAGEFPSTYKEIIKLKGVGKYTAAAISSFAYDLCYPVVDGNVIRVISRYFGIEEAVDLTSTLKQINKLASELINSHDPAKYNQAIMDFGALQCSPKSPQCPSCPLSESCVSNHKGIVNKIPYKSKKIKKRNRYFHYFIISDNNEKLLIKQRGEKDIWQSLYDYPLLENELDKDLSRQMINHFLEGDLNLEIEEVIMPVQSFKHVLSHQNIFGRFYQVKVKEALKSGSSIRVIDKSDFSNYAIPVLLSKYAASIDELSLF